MAINLSYMRSRVVSVRDEYGARIGLVQALVDRLRAGENVPVAEVERTRRLAWGLNPDGTPGEQPVRWRDVFFGRKDVG